MAWDLKRFGFGLHVGKGTRLLEGEPADGYDGVGDGHVFNAVHLRKSLCGGRAGDREWVERRNEGKGGAEWSGEGLLTPAPMLLVGLSISTQFSGLLK